jgi:hypothetical protein
MTRGMRIGRAAGLLALVAGLAMPASSAMASRATASVIGETLVAYSGPAKVKAAKRISFPVICAVTCNLSADMTLALPGPNLGPVTVQGSLQAGQAGEPFIKPNGPALQDLKANLGRSKLITSITATDVTTGETDTDTRTFKFSR